MTTPWLEARLDGLTGTDAGAILGVCPWKSPLEVWAEKTRRIVAEDIGHIERVRWGNLLEPVIIKEACERIDHFAASPERWDHFIRGARPVFLDHGGVEKAMLFSEAHPWLRVTPDAVVLPWQPSPLDPGPAAPTKLLEAKAVGAFKRHEWLDGGPPMYRVQLLAGMVAADLDHGIFAALVGGNELFLIDYERNARLGSLLVERLERFWFEHVVADTPPPASELDAELVAKLWPTRASAPPVEFKEPAIDIAVRELERIDKERKGLSASLRSLDKKRSTFTNQVRQALGESPCGRTPSGLVVEVKPSSQFLKIRRETPEETPE